MEALASRGLLSASFDPERTETLLENGILYIFIILRIRNFLSAVGLSRQGSRLASLGDYSLEA